MSGARPGRAARRARVSLVLGALLLLAGCTGGEGSAGPTLAPPSPETSTAPADGDGVDDGGADGGGADGGVVGGVDPADLSRQVLDAAAPDRAGPASLGSQTLEVPTGLTGDVLAEVTVDVRQVRRREGSTLVTVAMSSPQQGVQLAPDTFSDRRNLFVLHQLALEDRAQGRRYLPLAWSREISTPDNLQLDRPPNTCVCPDRTAELGPEPVLMDLLFGPLPATTTTVSLISPDGLLRVDDLPVG